MNCLGCTAEDDRREVCGAPEVRDRFARSAGVAGPEIACAALATARMRAFQRVAQAVTRESATKITVVTYNILGDGEKLALSKKHD